MAATPFTAALVGAALLGSACGREPVVKLGGPVPTLDAENRVVEALAVEDGHIAAVAEAAALRAWAHAHGARIVEADLVVLDRNPLDDPATIDRIRVLETVVGGETVYSAEAGAASSSP